MTDFKVTDEAVSAALDCQPFTYRNSAQRAWQELNLSEPDRVLFVRSVIEAALPVMFERAGFTNTEELNELIAGRGGWVSGLELDGDTVTLYRIKEPK